MAPEAPSPSNEVAHEPFMSRNFKRIAAVAVALTTVVALTQINSGDEAPSPSTFEHVQPDYEGHDPHEPLNGSEWSYEDARQVAGWRAHTSLSDNTYPENPAKTVRFVIDCAVVPAEAEGMSWHIDNPLVEVVQAKRPDDDEAMTVFAGVIPFAERFSDGTLKYTTVQAFSIGGIMVSGYVGSSVIDAIDTSNVRLERTTIERDPEEMPPDIFNGHAVVYLKDIDGNNPPQEGRIPAHVTYVTDSEDVQHVRKSLEMSLNGN